MTSINKSSRILQKIQLLHLRRQDCCPPIIGTTTTTTTRCSSSRRRYFSSASQQQQPLPLCRVPQIRNFSIIRRPPPEKQEYYDLQQQQSDYGSNNYYSTGPNPGLESIISQGIPTLQRTAYDIEQKTRRTSLNEPHKTGSYHLGTLEPRQLAESQRILDVAIECLEDIVSESENGKLTKGQNDGLVLFGEPIVLLECIVNRNIKQAKLYWTLPYSILLDERINQKVYQQIVERLNKDLIKNGGSKLLGRHIHSRLSSYYPPRIKLIPATDEMIQKAIEEL